MSGPNPYAGREQTYVKHFMLRKYLSRFAHIVGTYRDTLTYVDCFSGPWNVQSEKYEDSSFTIALDELRKARDTHAKSGKKLALRCLFLEKDPKAFRELDEYAKGVQDAEVKAHQGELEKSVGEVVAFVQEGGTKSFPFIFIDPTGWTGFDMDLIAPLLRLDPSEVLINFMTGHIRRFLDSPQEQTRDSFRKLFGSEDFRERIQGVTGQAREDAAVTEYMRNACTVGKFNYGRSAIVLNPEKNRTHFNLIYLTRNTKGVEVFKEAEKAAMKAQELARAEASQRKRVNKTRQLELLGALETSASSHYDSLRDRYLAKTRGQVLAALKATKRLLYDDAWLMATAEPLSWESDLKEWIEAWVKEGHVSVEGMKPRQKVPHRDENNFLIWK